VKKTSYFVGLIGAGALLAAPIQAADEPVDAELLEFLGTVDSSEADWGEYLAATDVDAVAKGRTAAGKAANPATPPPGNGTEKESQP
jgi:hypothetical protein